MSHPRRTGSRGWSTVLVGGVCAALPQSTRLDEAGGVELGYKVVDLGIASSVEAINDNGIAVGFLQVAPGTSVFVPLLWTNGVPHPLQELGPGNGQARDINDSRQIAGWTIDAGFDARPVRWEDGVPVDLGSIAGTDGKANAINQQGWVVGWATVTPGELPQAFLTDGTTSWLIGPPLPVSSEAHGINDRGQVVGFFKEPLEDERAFVFAGGVLRDLGGLGGFSDAQARDVNDAGDIVGFCELTGLGCCEETLWSLDLLDPLRQFRRPRGLGSPGSNVNRAHAVGARRVVVGDSNGRAFLWKDGSFRYLDDLLPAASGWTLLEARDVNRYGQVVGVGLHAGEPRGYLLSPLPHLLVHDEVQHDAPIPLSLTSRAGDRYAIYSSSGSGTAKVVVEGLPAWLDLGGQPILEAQGTLGPAGRVDLVVPSL